MEQNSEKLNYCYVNEDLLDSEFTIFVKRKENIRISDLLSNSNDYFYYDFNEEFLYYINNKDKLFFKRRLDIVDKQALYFPFYEYLTTDYSLKNKLKLVFEWKISDYDNDRYEITTKNNYKIIFDKNTGIALSVININPNERVDQVIKEFKFDCVTDEDVKLPDLSEYKEVQSID